jgi:hypothetical protein
MIPTTTRVDHGVQSRGTSTKDRTEAVKERVDAVDDVERIGSNGKVYAYIIRGEIDPKQTTFLTPSDLKQQVGFVVYPAGGEVKRHVHRALERHLVGTSEVIVVRKGLCELDVYDDERRHVATRELRPGDIMIMTGGGHGFRMIEDTVLLEVKQGPYTGIDEKEHF